MSTKTPKEGAGHFQWRDGTWLMCQVGQTAWLVSFAFLVMPRSTLLSVVFLGCALLPNLVGLILWSYRDRIAPYHAIQSLLIVAGVSTFAALIAADFLNIPVVYEARPSEPFRRELYIILLFYPLFSFRLRVKERMGRQRKTKEDETSED